MGLNEPQYMGKDNKSISSIRDCECLSQRESPDQFLQTRLEVLLTIDDAEFLILLQPSRHQVVTTSLAKNTDANW
jgi:hypothetical protein